MKPFLVKPARCLRGQLEFPGDKSIAHRAVIISALSACRTIIRNFPSNKDCLSTVNALRQLGVKINYASDKRKTGSGTVTVFGVGLFGLAKPQRPIFVGDSGTTFRLMLGLLAGQDFQAILKAGRSLSKRPMSRVNIPLRLMGAEIIANSRSKNEEYPPVIIKGGSLKPITYKMPVASAQVKSAILLAGLYAKGSTCVIEAVKSRDHTERMLKFFKAGLKVKGNTVVINGASKLRSPGEIKVPGDISSAAFFIVLGSICRDSRILLKNIGLNPFRSGAIKVLKRMGADIKYQAPGIKHQTFEPAGSLLVKSSDLKSTRVKKTEIPSLIDELPILMVAACFAKGKTVFEGVGELRVKETDRIKSMVDNLNRMGADIRLQELGGLENIIIRGVKGLRGACVKSFCDHRTAMSMAVAGLLGSGNTRIDDAGCIKKSFPDFLRVLRKIVKSP